MVHLLLDVSKFVVKVCGELAAMSGPTDMVLTPDPTHSDLYNNRYRSTGTMYGATVKRHRPIYPKLDSTGPDQSAHSISDHDSSNPYEKHFKQFRKLNGGITLMWCKHRICVGFHIIEKGEGRNDVFSPIYTRWTKAPELIVYDFACQLASYNMVRRH